MKTLQKSRKTFEKNNKSIHLKQKIFIYNRILLYLISRLALYKLWPSQTRSINLKHIFFIFPMFLFITFSHNSQFLSNQPIIIYLQRRNKYRDSKLKALKSRNEYILCLEASNTTIHKYFVDDLSDLIDVSIR